LAEIKRHSRDAAKRSHEKRAQARDAVDHARKLRAQTIQRRRQD
jgi:hypothetical protein